MDSDRIIVLGHGKIMEMGVPHLLLENQAGALTELVAHTGQKTQERLRAIAKEYYDKKEATIFIEDN